MNKNTHEDYEKDGILYCGKCNTPKQVIIQVPKFDGTGGKEDRTVPCLCRCAKEQRDKVNRYYEEQEKLRKLNDLLKQGFIETDLLRKIHFEDMDENSENEDKAKKYVDRFEDFKKDGIGFMLYGTVGNGKTFTAAAIANELIKNKIPVAFMSTASYMNLTFEQREWILNNHRRFPLLVLDDFGVERTTDYGTEQIYNLVDSRYKSGLPMIVTTNKMPSELEKEENIAQKRINDRIAEMCLPVQFKQESRRKARKSAKMAAAKQFFLE